MTFRLTARAAAIKDKPTWGCLNVECHRVFSTHDRNPVCPHCGNVRVVPAVPTFAIQHASTGHADRTLRDVAQNFKLTNLRSAREGEMAHPGLPTPKVIPGTAPLNAGAGVQIPRTFTPSAQFAPMPREIKGTIPTGFAFNKRGRRSVPTKVKYRTMPGDPT
jgi:hypothetical protein